MILLFPFRQYLTKDIRTGLVEKILEQVLQSNSTTIQYSAVRLPLRQQSTTVR